MRNSEHYSSLKCLQFRMRWDGVYFIALASQKRIIEMFLRSLLTMASFAMHKPIGMHNIGIIYFETRPVCCCCFCCQFGHLLPIYWIHTGYTVFFEFIALLERQLDHQCQWISQIYLNIYGISHNWLSNNVSLVLATGLVFALIALQQLKTEYCN